MAYCVCMYMSCQNRSGTFSLKEICPVFFCFAVLGSKVFIGQFFIEARLANSKILVELCAYT